MILLTSRDVTITATNVTAAGRPIVLIDDALFIVCELQTGREQATKLVAQTFDSARKSTRMAGTTQDVNRAQQSEIAVRTAIARWRI